MKCSHCLKSIDVGSYFRDYWGNCYHQSHINNPRCSYCGRIVSRHNSNGFKRYGDGSIICGLCSLEAVDRDSQISLHLQYVLNFLKKIGIDLDKYKCEKYLLARGASKRVKREEPGYINFSMTKRGSEIINISFKIFIIKGLPKEYFIETLTHELMHQWIILYGQKKIKPVLNEGSCNYIAYLIMKEMNTPLSNYIINRLLKDNHPFYGKGFRKVLDYSLRFDHKETLDFIRSRVKI